MYKNLKPSGPENAALFFRIDGDAFYKTASGLSLRRYELPEKSKNHLKQAVVGSNCCKQFALQCIRLVFKKSDSYANFAAASSMSKHLL
jgi:hypothetical protein